MHLLTKCKMSSKRKILYPCVFLKLPICCENLDDDDVLTKKRKVSGDCVNIYEHTVSMSIGSPDKIQKYSKHLTICACGNLHLNSSL